MRRDSRTKKQRRAIAQRGLVGRWIAFARWQLFSHQTFVQYGGHVGAGRALVKGYRCPVCHRHAGLCIHVPLDVQYFLVEHGMGKLPAESYGPGGWAKTS